jgi:hypothetical protein
MRRRELSRRAQAFGFVVAMTFALGVQLPLAAFAQDGIDPVTRFARDPVHVAVWPGGRKVAVSFALFVEEFGFGQGPVFRPDLATRNRTSSTRLSDNTRSTGASRASAACSGNWTFRSPSC